MPEATPEELAELGVEIGVVTSREPPRARFVERKLKDEPDTDKKIVVDGPTKMAFRERITRVDQLATGVRTPAADPSPTTIILGISNALLDEKDELVLNKAGQPMIATCYTVTMNAEALGRIGTPEKLKEVLKVEREKAAHQARLEFEGMLLADQLHV